MTANARFLDKVTEMPSGCHEFVGERLPKGYGRYWAPELGKRVYAHRYAWELANGRTLRPEEIVCHSCDNPPCVNPGHLFAGTQSDNLRDMVGKSRHPFQKLSMEDVAEIKRRYMPRCLPNALGHRNKRSNAQELAQEFGVCSGRIKAIVGGVGHHIVPEVQA